MSAEYCSWASDQKTGSPLAKLVLLRIADCTDPLGWAPSAGISISGLAEWCQATIEDTMKAVIVCEKTCGIQYQISGDDLHVRLPERKRLLPK